MSVASEDVGERWRRSAFGVQRSESRSKPLSVSVTFVFFVTFCSNSLRSSSVVIRSRSCATTEQRSQKLPVPVASSVRTWNGPAQVQRSAFSVRSRSPKTSLSFRTFVFFVTFCSNSLRSLLFHQFPTTCRHRACYTRSAFSGGVGFGLQFLCVLCFLLFNSLGFLL